MSFLLNFNRRKKKMEEQNAETLPTLVDNSEKFTTVEKETSPSLTVEEISGKIGYPKMGDMLIFLGQRFEVIQEHSRHRFTVKWRG
jgi:hypothetical protein